MRCKHEWRKHFTWMCKWRSRCKAWIEVETCIYSCKCKCIHEDENEIMEVNNDLYSHFQRKEEVKIHGKRKWHLFVFSKYDFWSKSNLLDAITRKAFCVIELCEWKRKMRWMKMETENEITCMCGWRMKWKTCNRICRMECEM